MGCDLARHEDGGHTSCHPPHLARLQGTVQLHSSNSQALSHLIEQAVEAKVGDLAETGEGSGGRHGAGVGHGGHEQPGRGGAWRTRAAEQECIALLSGAMCTGRWCWWSAYLVVWVAHRVAVGDVAEQAASAKPQRLVRAAHLRGRMRGARILL